MAISMSMSNLGQFREKKDIVVNNRLEKTEQYSNSDCYNKLR